MNIKREVKVLLISTILLFFGSFVITPVHAAEKEMITMYFHEDYEDYLLLGGSFGHLNDTFPVADKISDAAVGSFELQDVSTIDGDITCKLYFRVPPVNTTVIDSILYSLSESLLNINITGGYNATELFKTLWENVTNMSWSFFWSLIANMSLSDEETFNLKITSGTGTLISDEETISVRRTFYEPGTLISILENLSEGNITAIFTETMKALQQMNQKIILVTVTVHDVHYHAEDPSESLFIEIESTNLLAEVKELIDQFGDLNLSSLINLFQLLEILPSDANFSYSSPEVKALKALLNIFNYTKSFILPLINISFIYGSTDYPASITFEGSLSQIREVGARRYYLHEKVIDGTPKRILDENPPMGEGTRKTNLSNEEEYWTLYPSYGHPTRIHGDVNLTLYINYSNIFDLMTNPSLESLFSFKYTVKCSLLDVDEVENAKEFASNTTTTTIKQHLFTGATTMMISDVDYVIEEGHDLRLGVSIVNHTLSLSSLNITIFNFTISDILHLLDILGFTPPQAFLGEEPVLLYDSTKFPSNIELTLAPLDDIKLMFKSGTVADQHVLKVENAPYNIAISNKGSKNDTVNITVSVIDPTFLAENEAWQVWIDGVQSKTTSLTVAAGKTVSMQIEIHPPNDAEYGDNVTIKIKAEGNRGRDELSGSVTVSSELKKFDVEIVKPEDREARIGRSFNYTFKITNTGNDVDTFIISVKSNKGWANNSDVHPTQIKLKPGEEAEFNVTVSIPAYITPGTEDILTVTVSSDIDPTKQKKTAVITTAVAPTIVQMITESFDSAAEWMGLNTVLGSAAGTVLLATVVIVAVATAILLLYLFTRKFALLICLDRVKEVELGKKARFEITLKNPTNQRLTYNILTNEDSLPEGWSVSLFEKEVRLDPDEEYTITLSVATSSNVNPDGYAEIKVTVIPKEKPKPASISLLAIVKGAQVDLRITNVFHWPKTFKAGDIITTKLAVHNKGNVTAKNVTVTFSVNGVEKNRVENLSIPPKGYADIKIPWVASPGENAIRISVGR
ncbi:MAG TPA: hypothetical protein EYP23_04055 [Thermoplasmata archaeon]|nr:hypothetical protein [Thermoplasmata archaeon]